MGGGIDDLARPAGGVSARLGGRETVAQFAWIMAQSLTPGRERAKARGVILGRKPKLTGHLRREAIARREAGEVLMDISSFI